MTNRLLHGLQDGITKLKRILEGEKSEVGVLTGMGAEVCSIIRATRACALLARSSFCKLQPRRSLVLQI